MNLTLFPAHPSLEQYKKQAKDFVKLGNAGDAEVLRRVKQWHSRSFDNDFALADAQLVIAREHGFNSWPKFAEHIEELTRAGSTVSKFELAAEAIVTGDAAALKSLLRENPELVRARSTRWHRATLLHYVGANGFEDYRQKSPKNTVAIAKILLDAGATVDAVAELYGGSTTLGLAATSIYPKQAGVQIALLETLLAYGAAVDGVPGVGTPLISALHNGRPEAAEFLAEHNAQMDLEGAAGVGWLEAVERFFNGDGSLKANATKAQMERGFLWACEYGRNRVVDSLFKKGVDLHTKGNTGQTGLHWAVIGGQLETVQMLLERGASLEERNEYGGTALGQALWSAINGDSDSDHVSVIEMLLRAGAKIEDGSLEWLRTQGGRSAPQKERIAEVLRSHGANT